MAGESASSAGVVPTGNCWPFDAANPQAAPRLLLRRSAPMQGLRHGPAGIELLLARTGRRIKLKSKSMYKWWSAGFWRDCEHGNV